MPPRSPQRRQPASVIALPSGQEIEPLTRERIEELLESWSLALRADRHRPNTIRTYSDGVRAYLRWAEEQGEPPDLSRRSAQRFIVHLLESGRSPATALSRQRGLSRFSQFLHEEGEIERDDLAGMKHPRQEVKPPRALTDQEVRALLATCEGSRAFADLRDHAILSTLADTGCRTGELLALTLDDLDLRNRRILIRHTKTGKGRIAAFGPQTARSLDRYLRSRRRQLYADLPNLWLSTRSPGTLSYHATYMTLRRRAALAGVEGFHPHCLRSTAAIRWLEKGGSPGGIMALAGWTNAAMLRHYVSSPETELAIRERERLDLDY